MTQSIQKPQALYRYFDKDNRLLYVGISSSFFDRNNTHAMQSSWIHQAAKVTIEWYETRSEVESQEIYAIQNEHPLHNKAHSVLPFLAHLNEIEFKKLNDDFHLAISEKIDLLINESFELIDGFSSESINYWAFVNAIYDCVAESSTIPCKICAKFMSTDLPTTHHGLVCDYVTKGVK